MFLHSIQKTERQMEKKKYLVGKSTCNFRVKSSFKKKLSNIFKEIKLCKINYAKDSILRSIFFPR